MNISPFKAVRPDKAYAAKVAALPYDVYDEAEARAEVQDKPLSFLNADRPETQFPEGQDMYAPEVYEKASALLETWLRKGVLIREDKPCYYLYSLTMDGRTQRGLVACSSVDDYITGRIKKHENTRREKEEDRVRHIDVTSMQTGPIFLAYRGKAEVKALLDEAEIAPPLFDFVSPDGIRHTGYRIEDDDLVLRITEAFAAIPNTYIADGHHRAASAVRVCQKRREAHPNYRGDEEFNSFLTVIFPDEELKIMDYNRLVKKPKGLSDEEILKAISEHYEVKKAGLAGSFEKPAEKGICGLFLSGAWYSLKAKPDILSDDPVEGLDVQLLQKYVLEPVFGIKDPKTDPNIDFVGGIRGVKELEKRSNKENSAAFLMYPTSMAELFNVADAGLLMPPKSTWFEPKLRSGLFIHEIER